MTTDMRSPDVIFGKAWKIFLLLIIQLTLERETSNKNTGGGKPPQNTAGFQKYTQSKSPASRKGTWISNIILPTCHSPAFGSDHPSQHHSRQGCREKKLKLIFGSTGTLSQSRRNKYSGMNSERKQGKPTSGFHCITAQPGRTSPLAKPLESCSFRSQEMPTAGFGLQVGVQGSPPPPQREKSRQAQLPSLLSHKNTETTITCYLKNRAPGKHHFASVSPVNTYTHTNTLQFLNSSSYQQISKSKTVTLWKQRPLFFFSFW